MTGHGERRRRRRDEVARVAVTQEGVMGRRQLYAMGLTRHEVMAEVRAGRWSRLGPQCLQVGPTTERTAWRRALFEIGPSAVLDGISALQAAGLRNIKTEQIHVAVPKSVTPHRCRGVRVHETRRHRSVDVLREPIPRMQPSTAAVHAALWARTDREAAFVVVATAQQRLTTVAALHEAVELVRRHRRRALLRGLLCDLGGGAETLAEREFARLCRRRGFPAPTCQQVRRTASGTVIFDVAWERFRVIVEIDGVHHLQVGQTLSDALKQNTAALDGATVLRIPNWALRADPEPFLDQVERALIAGGWTPPLRPADCRL